MTLNEALDRIEALEKELGAAHSDARELFAQRAAAERDRDVARVELDNALAMVEMLRKGALKH